MFTAIQLTESEEYKGRRKEFREGKKGGEGGEDRRSWEGRHLKIKGEKEDGE